MGDGGLGTCCNNACLLFDPSTDNAHCGACDNQCPLTSTCYPRVDHTLPASDGGIINVLDQPRCHAADAGAATCAMTCPAGTACFGPGHCESASSCSSTARCVRTSCAGANDEQACGAPPDEYRSNRCCSAQCVALNDPQNCGACGVACGSNQFCNGFNCQNATVCGSANQGQLCATATTPRGVCVGSSCEVCAAANQGVPCSTPAMPNGVCAGGACQSTNLHCGALGKSCSALSCTNGACATADGGLATCAPSQATSDRFFACAAGTECVDDVCVTTACQGALEGSACLFGPARWGVCTQGHCVDLTQDPTSCGAIGASCPDGTCSRGRCVPHVAACAQGISCTVPPSTFCVGRECFSPTPGFHNGICRLSNGNPGISCGFGFMQCVDPASDAMNCGACDTRCASGWACVAGVCRKPGLPLNCGAGENGAFCQRDAGDQFLCCPGAACTDTLSDRLNCGRCGAECAGDCRNGQCAVVGCSALTEASSCWGADGGQHVCCNSACADFNSDPRACGGCGRQCATSETCRGGHCGADLCSVGSSGSPCHRDAGVGLCCGAACVDYGSDRLNCGGCGRTCAGDAGCFAGTCR